MNREATMSLEVFAERVRCLAHVEQLLERDEPVTREDLQKLACAIG